MSRAGAKNQMEMIREYGESQQIDPEEGGEVFQVLFDPNLSVVEVFPRNRIFSKQETASHRTAANMGDLDLTGVQYFFSALSHEVTNGIKEG